MTNQFHLQKLIHILRDYLETQAWDSILLLSDNVSLFQSYDTRGQNNLITQRATLKSYGNGQNTPSNSTLMYMMVKWSCARARARGRARGRVCYHSVSF